MQGNGQKCNNEWCPNTIFSNGSVSIGEFKTLEEAMNFPKKEIWCINRTNDNLFNKYQSQGVRVLIVCDWVKPTQDSQKFVVALVGKNGKISYWDMNDTPINHKIYENSIDNDVLYAIYSVADEMYKNSNQENINCNRNMNKKLIRLTESDLHRIVRESVNKVLMEASGLDPRTTANAAEKARMRGQYDRAKMFKNASVDSWNEKFADGDMEGFDSEFFDPKFYDGSVSLGDGGVSVKHTKDNGYGDIYKPKCPSRNGEDYRFYWREYGKNKLKKEPHITTPMTKGEKVASQMVRGDGEYIKGKGWKD